MATQMTADLSGFSKFVQEKLDNGGAGLSPEQVLALWRERVDTIAAVHEGIQAVDEGNTKSLDQFSQDFCARHGIVNET